jgi:predicted ATPase
MAYRRNRPINLPAPYLKRVWLDPSRVGDPAAYPFCLPFLQQGFELDFEHAITIIVGENGTGKSTLLEGIAALAGYDEAGGGKGYMPVDHSGAIEAMGGRLSKALRASWLPKITNGWFFRAESFFSVARYLDRAAVEGGGIPPDFLSHSHGEASCGSLRSAASGKASSFSTSRSPPCRRRGKSSFSSCCAAWINRISAR